jgi:hypothetical protein
VPAADFVVVHIGAYVGVDQAEPDTVLPDGADIEQGGDIAPLLPRRLPVGDILALMDLLAVPPQMPVRLDGPHGH